MATPADKVIQVGDIEIRFRKDAENLRAVLINTKGASIIDLKMTKAQANTLGDVLKVMAA